MSVGEAELSALIGGDTPSAFEAALRLLEAMVQSADRGAEVDEDTLTALGLQRGRTDDLDLRLLTWAETRSLNRVRWVAAFVLGQWKMGAPSPHARGAAERLAAREDLDPSTAYGLAQTLLAGKAKPESLRHLAEHPGLSPAMRQSLLRQMA